jgi:O-antigen ligase
MNRIRKTTNRNEYFFWFFVVFFSSALGILFWMATDETVKNVVLLLLGMVLAIVILRFPLVGFGILIASTPLVELLPRVSFVSSILVPLGGLTLFAFFANKGQRDSIQWRLSSVEVLALLYIIWIFLSNPDVSYFGRGRSWILTFSQLWVLLWMARNFVRSEEDHQLIMVVVTLGILTSGIAAVQQVGLGFGLTERATGLSGGANTASRYFLYGIVILSYLQSRSNERPGVRLLALVGIILLILALITTFSRSGFLLLGIAFLFITQRFLIGRQRSMALWFTIGIGLVWVLTQASGTVLDPIRILNAIVSGSDTVGGRYDIWRAGLAMWQDHPIFGIGIGQFSYYYLSYSRSPGSIAVLSAHNTYIQVLSETGFVGFVFFIALLFVVVVNFRSQVKNSEGNLSNIHWTWMIVIVLMLIGSMSKTELFDKFFWFLMGISINMDKKSLE